MLAQLAAILGPLDRALPLGVLPSIARLQSRLEGASPERSPLRSGDVPSLARLLDHEQRWWVEDLGVRLGQQILDVAHHLFGPPTPGFRTPSPTVFPWHLLLARTGEVLYRALAHGTSQERRRELVTTLDLWLRAGFPRHLARVRLVRLQVDRARLPGLETHHPDRLVGWGDRFFVRHHFDEGGRATVSAIQVREGNDFQLPEGATLVSSTPADERLDERASRPRCASWRTVAPYRSTPRSRRG